MITDPLNFYVAGLIDGEGTITLTTNPGNSKYRMPVISISSTTLPMLTFMKDRYGGTISTHKVYKQHHKQSWSWKAVYNGAIKVCDDINGLLLEPEKQRRVSLLLNEYHLVTKRNGKYSTDEANKKLDFEKRFFES